MNKIEELSHLRLLFERADVAGKLKLIERLRDAALKYLSAGAIARVPQPFFPKPVRDWAKLKGISLDWNLTDTRPDTGIHAFCMTAQSLSPSEEKAASLVQLCVVALETRDATERTQNEIRESYAGLDLDAVVTGKKFTQGRKPNSGGPIRKKIASQLKKNPTWKNPKLWHEVANYYLPNGWTVIDGKDGPWLDGPTADKHMTQKNFFNICGDERKKIRK